MGFRNPAQTADPNYLDTAGSVDTSPGVRVYQGTDEFGRQRGTVEFRSGVPGDEPAHLTLQSYTIEEETPDGESYLRSFGSLFRLYGGKTNETFGPYFDLELREPAVGGDPYTRVASLNADYTETDGPLVAMFYGPGGTSRSGIPGAYRPGWGRYSTNNPGNTQWQDAALYKLPDGTVRLQGLFQYVGGAGATTHIYTLGTDVRPSSPPGYEGRSFIVPLVVNDALRACSVRSSDGFITLRGALPAAATYCAFDLAWPGPEFLWT